MRAEKTRAEVYEQWQRVFQAFMRRGRRLARAAHPETRGIELLVHNWGNDAARAAWARTWARETAARAIYERLYDAADHRTHGRHFRPLWCDACKVDHSNPPPLPPSVVDVQHVS